MKTTKKIVALFLAVLMSLSLFSGTLTAFAATKKVTKVTLNKTSATLFTTQTLTLKATVAPSNASNKKVKWTTSDKSIATVSSSGVVKAVKAGKATITATAADGSGKKATCKITVKKLVKITSMKMSNKTINAGASATLKVTVTPSNASITTYTWKSSNTKVAKVNSSGKVTGVSAGTATITATATDGSGKKATCKVTVNGALVSGVKLDKTSATLEAGKSVTLKATVSPANAADKSLKWKSSDTGVAKVSSSGKVTAVAVGTATITATAADGSGKKATCKVTVTAPKVTSVKLNQTSATVYPGKSVTLTATVAPTNAGDKTVKWTTSNDKVATVTSKGVVKGIAVGTATITATANDGSGKKATCKVTVGAYVSDIIVTSPVDRDSSWYVNKTGKVIASVVPSDALNKEVTWSSSNTKYATVDSNGNVKAIKKTSGGLGVPSSVTITATAKDGSGVKGTYKMVIGDFKAVSSITFNNNTPTQMFSNEEASFKAVITPEDASERAIKYTTSNPKLATVDSNGNVKIGVLPAGQESATVTIYAASESNPNAKVAKEITIVPVSIDLKFSYKRDFYTVGEKAYPYCVTTPDTAINKLGNRFESEDESVACFDPLEYNSQRYAILNFVGPGKTRVRAITAGKEAVSEWIDIEVRELRTDKDFFQNASVGDAYTIEAYIFNGEKLPVVNALTDIPEIEAYLGEYEQYFNVSFENGKFRVVLIGDLPSDGASITFRTPDGRMSKKVWFIKDKYTVPSGTKAQLLNVVKDYSVGVSNLVSASGTKLIDYQKAKVDSSKSKSDMTVKYKTALGIPIEMSLKDLMNMIGSDDEEDIMEEMTPEALVRDLYTGKSEENIIVDSTRRDACQPKIEVALDDVANVEVINDDNKVNYQIKLTLKEQKQLGIDSVKTSAYGKTMKVIDKAFMDKYAQSLDFGDESFNSSLEYGSINQTYKDGYVIYTVNKRTNKVVESEYHYKSDMKIDNAKLNMSASISDSEMGTGKVTINVKMTAYFTMTVETTAKYNSMNY